MVEELAEWGAILEKIDHNQSIIRFPDTSANSISKRA